jgi:hypothetical protein
VECMANSRGQRGPGVPAPVTSSSPGVSQGMQGPFASPPAHLIANFSGEPVKDHTGGYDLGELEQPLSFNIDEELDLPDRNSGVTSRPTLHILPSGPFLSSHSFNKQRQQQSPHQQQQSPHQQQQQQQNQHQQQQQQQQSSQVTSPSAASTDSRSAHFTSRRPSFESPSARQFEHWGDSRMADNNSPRTDTSTDMEAEVKVDNWVNIHTSSLSREAFSVDLNLWKDCTQANLVAMFVWVCMEGVNFGSVPRRLRLWIYVLAREELVDLFRTLGNALRLTSS